MQKKLYLCTAFCTLLRPCANTNVLHFSDRTRHKRIDMRPKSFPRSPLLQPSKKSPHSADR